jgi:hypothetical protein
LACPFFEVADGPGNLAQQTGPVDDGRDLPGLEKLTQHGQIGFVLAGQEENHPLAHRRRYLLAGLLTCGTCGRRMESAWSNGKPAYRCRHGHTSAVRPDPARPKNAYVREDKILAQLPALHSLLTCPRQPGAGAAARGRRRTRRGTEINAPANAGDIISCLREHRVTLTWDQAAATLHAGTPQAITIKAS